MNIKKEKTLEDFIYMEQLELKYYSEEHITPHQEAFLWHLSNPNTGFVLEDDGRIAAFSDILPVKPEIFGQIVRGTLNDKYLTSEDMVSMDDLKAGDTVNLLLSCILVDDDYRDTDALKTLLNAHMDYYREYREKGIRIDSIATSNVTEAGERFSERMGFQRIGNSEHKTALYLTGFDDFDRQVRNMKSKLQNLLFDYEQKLSNLECHRKMKDLEDIIGQEFMEYGQSGRIYSREEAIEQLCCEKDTRVDIQYFTLKCLNRNVALVHYIALRKNKTNGEILSRSLRTSVWSRENESWKLHFHQGTEVRDPDGRA
jgi:hypothetical protein